MQNQFVFSLIAELHQTEVVGFGTSTMHAVDKRYKVQVSNVRDLKGFLFHDSPGLEAEAKSNNSFLRIRGFINQRQGKISFRKQLHCVW
jgi:hypothetical protein